jgi:hypothetical protein
VARDVRISSRVSKEMHRQIVEMARQRGVTQSALIAWVIGEWILEQERVRPVMKHVGNERRP